MPISRWLARCLSTPFRFPRRHGPGGFESVRLAELRHVLCVFENRLTSRYPGSGSVACSTVVPPAVRGKPVWKRLSRYRTGRDSRRAEEMVEAGFRVPCSVFRVSRLGKSNLTESVVGAMTQQTQARPTIPAACPFPQAAWGASDLLRYEYPVRLLRWKDVVFR